MAKFLHLTEMRGLHLPWLDVVLPSTDTPIDFLSQCISQSLTFNDLKSADNDEDVSMTPEKTTGSATATNQPKSCLQIFDLDMDSTLNQVNEGSY